MEKTLPKGQTQNERIGDYYGKILKLHNDFIEEQRRNLNADFSYGEKFIKYVDDNSDVIVDSEEFKEAIKWCVEDENDFENKVRESID